MHKEDLALNNQQYLIYVIKKTKPNHIYLIYLYKKDFESNDL